MRYEGEHLKYLLFPVGGIGTGSVSVSGEGLLRDFEIFGRPNKGSVLGFTGFFVRAETPDGKVYTKALVGDVKENLTGIYNQRFSHSHGYGYGLPSASFNGFPHFSRVTADCEYPVASLTFSDDDFPGDVTLTAWNPLIPHDSFNSSLPAAFFRVAFANQTGENVKFTAAFVLGNPFDPSVNTKKIENGLASVTMTSVKEKDEIGYGDITAACPKDGAFAQTHFYRGGWCDAIVTFWRELETGDFRDRSYPDARCDHAMLARSVTSDAHETAQTDFVYTWNVPNAYNYWSPVKDEFGADLTWKHWYATRFASSRDSAAYTLAHLSDLWDKTALYRKAMFSQTLPPYIVDAAASTLSVLRSATVMRLENGAFYGFEGCGEKEGSCEGTCQHVWNYAYALCFLFPDLERSIRELEFTYQTASDGCMDFRLKLPLGRDMTRFPCFDGQTGAVIKTLREWKLSGDTAWLKKQYPAVKKVLSFAWSADNPFRWDAAHKGVADGRMHHTLDMELFGASGWLQGLYLAALKAAESMAKAVGDDAFAAECASLFESGYNYTKERLFNGSYFVQDIDLTDKSVVDAFGCAATYFNDETGEIKYQIGEGCEIDQLLGAWHASICGIGRVFDEEQLQSAASALYRNNFKPSLRGFTNPWRLFAVNDEPGSIICAYPDGAKKPAIPIPYCEECMNGFEYALAGTLIACGRLEEGLAVAKAVRDKYNGANRNPYNEIECGSNYARSMASYALIPLLAGFSFDMPHGALGFAPKIAGNDFSCVWSAGNAFGTFTLTPESAALTVLFGSLSLKQLAVGGFTGVKAVCADAKPIAFTEVNGGVTFPETRIEGSLILSR